MWNAERVRWWLDVTILVLSLAVRSKGVVWTDWDKRQVCHPQQFIQPDSVDTLKRVVHSASDAGQQIKVVGAGHSFSSIPLTDDEAKTPSVMVNLDKLNRVLQLPRSTGQDSTVLVEAGIRVHDLNDALLAAGWALENTGAIAEQSVAGATQTGTHGTGKGLGSMSSQITELALLLANSTVINVSATTRTDVFDAARVGLGALGIVVAVRLHVVPAFKLKRVAMPYSLSALLEDLPRLTLQYDRLQWYYTPYTDDATLLLRTAVPLSTEIIPCWPATHPLLAGHLRSNETCIDWSFKALAHESAYDSTRALYTEQEMFVDVASEPALMQDFLKYQASVRKESQCANATDCSLFTGVRYGKADEMWMSPMYQRNIAVVSMIVGGPSDRSESGPTAEFDLFTKYGLERLAAKYQGRPHWGKMNWASAADLRSLYPRFDDFVRIRQELDPSGMFLNKYLRQILGL